jgi:tetratricopeptide (TPR) repeat protein
MKLSGEYTDPMPPRGRTFTAAALAAGLLLAPSTSFAAKILVLPYQCLGKGVPADLAEQATVVITKEMAQGGLTIIRADNVAEEAPKKEPTRRSQDAPTGDPGAGAKAEELIAKGKEAVEQDEAPAAIKDLKNAVRLLEENGDAVPDLRLLAEAYLQLGIAHFRDGNEDEGDEMLSKAVHLDPERQITDKDYPPLFVGVYQRARFNVLRRPRAIVEVKATKGAQVLFDGRNMGKAPLHLKEALPGNHWIRVERPGEPIQVKKIAVKANRTISVEFEGAAEGGEDAGPPVGVLGAIAANDITADHVAQLKSAGSRAGADFVMIGGIYKTDTAYMIRTAYVQVKDGTVGRLADVAFDLDMLSAEIEVYKLAEDAKKQASASFTNVVNDERFPIAAGFKSKVAVERRREKQEETKVAQIVAAPPTPPPPAQATFDEPAADAGGKGRAPLAAAGGGGETTEGEGETKRETVAVKPPPEVLPKDELDEQKPPEYVAAANNGASLSIEPKEDEEDSEPSTWWIWVIVGVVAAGAAGTGGYLVATGGSADEGNLRISW